MSLILIDEPQLFLNFISEEERIFLSNHAKNLLDKGILIENDNGPNRFYRSFYKLNFLHKEVHFLYTRILQTLNLKNPTIDPMLGIIISVIKPSGFIQSHTDAYKDNIHSFPQLKNYLDKKNFRFNVMVERDDDISYSPHIENNPFPVKEKDAWCFAASELKHHTPPIKGAKYRIVYQFGFAV